MSLQIITGASGSGKSTALYRKIIEESTQNPRQNYFIIVPDQFTMQTQMDLVTMSPRGGIMNIDVLSLNRLAHRIFEETGGNRAPVLDDTGKSLVLRKIAADLKEQTPIIGANLEKQGYIHEVKSAISEFMQYGIGTEQLEELTEYAKERGALFHKLKDLGVLYRGFLQYIHEQFITTEESMDILAQELYRSKLIRDSVVVFDGFTGFTPIQGKVIGALLELCKDVIITVTLDEKEAAETEDGEQSLFFFSQKTIRYLEKLAKDRDIPIQQRMTFKRPIRRFEGKEELAFLEENLFRYPRRIYKKEKEERIILTGCSDIRKEVKGTCQNIRRVLKETNCCYRDIAVIAGDLPTYESEIEEEFLKYELPLFMDKTRGILLNPFTEYIKSALEIIMERFSYESVFHYLRSGLADFTQEETDALENYVLEMGIRGRTSWERVFAGRTKKMKKSQNGLEELAYFNALRERLMKQLTPILGSAAGKEEKTVRQNTKFTTRELIMRLYEFILQNQVEEKLHAYEMLFTEQEMPEKAREYGQIYRLIMELLDQIMELVGNETMTIKEFSDILEAGFGEIEVGTIPQSVDRIIVGDIERTRLKPVKYLFFLGLNDGLIPKSASKGGIISDIDREYLSGSQMELAPTPRQQMYIQKFYLYLNMTKPSEKLFLSYAAMDLSGKAIRPSYLVSMIEEMFPECRTRDVQENAVGNLYEAKELSGNLLRKYAEGEVTSQEYGQLLTLLQFLYQEKEEGFLQQLLQNAFYRYQSRDLSQLLAGVLYGQTILSSISRMEKYAACAYSYFLQYGLSLREREEYGFEDRDIGTIFHGVLELFSRKLEEKHYTWMDFSKEEGKTMVAQALEEFCVGYTDALLYESATTRYTMERMERILNRAVQTISYQLKKGKYTPRHYEYSFEVIEDINDIGVVLNEEKKMKLRGKIDRIDTYEDEEHVYVKVVDYKSGNKDFDLAAFYKGTQLQLVVYMNEALKETAQSHPDKEPVGAALLYYHVADPLIAGEEGMSQENIGQKVLQELRTQGLVNGDGSVIQSMDQSMTTKSDCIPVEYKKDGSFTAASGVISEKELKLLSDFADYRLKSIGASIVKGEIPLNPCTQGQKDSCQYCSYQDVCGFDPKLKGYYKTEIEKEEGQELFTKMQEKLQGKEEA